MSDAVDLWVDRQSRFRTVPGELGRGPDRPGLRGARNQRVSRSPASPSAVRARYVPLLLRLRHVNKAANAAPPPYANLGTRFTVAYGIESGGIVTETGSGEWRIV